MNNLDPQSNPFQALHPPFLDPKYSDFSNKTHDLTPNADPKLKQKAEEILYKENGGLPYIPTSLKHFANIQASTILKDSGMEGIAVEETLEYWLNLFTQWEKNEAQIVNPGLSLKEIQTVIHSLQDCLDFIEIYKSNDPEKIAALLKSKLEQRKECYIPLGWKGTPGHFMIAKVRDRGTILSMELLTKGGGAEFHDKINQGSKKRKISYKSDPIVVDKELLLQSKVGLSFFKRLMEMKDHSVKYTPFAQELQGTDLYGLFNLIGETIPNKTQSTSPGGIIGVTPQRAGTCSDTGLRMTLYETILSTDPTRTSKDFKRSMHALKTQSLVDGFRQFRPQIERGEPQVCLYLRHAVQEHFTRLSKLYPEFITSDELALGLALGKEIDEKLKVAEEKIKALIPTIAMPELVEGKVSTQNTDVLSPIPTIQGLAVDNSDSYVGIIPQLTFETPNPTEATEKLESWIKHLEELYRNDSSMDSTLHPQIFNQVVMLMSKLPMPTGELEDPFWDKIPLNKRKECIHQLTQLALLANKTVPAAGQQARLFVINSRAYDIACQIAPTIPELKMKNIGFEWAWDIEKIHFKNESYSDADTTRTLKQLDENFIKRKERQKFKGYGHLFPSQLRASAEAGVAGFLPPSTHWFYVEQFYTANTKKEIFERRQKIRNAPHANLMFLEDPEKKYFPAPYYDLQTLAFLSSPHSSESQKAIGMAAEGRIWDVCKYQKSVMELEAQMKSPVQTDRSPPNPHLDSSPALQDFLRLSKVHYQYTENDILVSHPELNKYSTSEQLSKQTLQELALITTVGKQQVEYTLDWGSTNTHQIRNPAVQACMEEYLFKFNLLATALESNSEVTIQKIKDFLLSATDLYLKKPGEQQTLLWLAKIGSYLERYINVVANIENPVDLPDFHSILSQLLLLERIPAKKIDLLDHIILTFGSTKAEQLSEKDTTNLLSAMFKRQILKGSSAMNDSEVSVEAQYVYSTHRMQTEQLLINAAPEVRNRVLNHVMEELLDQHVPEVDWHWTGDRNKVAFVAGDYTIDIETFKVFKNNIELRDLSTQVGLSKNYQDVFSLEPFVYVQKEGIYYKQPNENARLIRGGQEFRVQKKMTVNGVDKWLEYEPLREGYINLPIAIPNNFKNGSYQFWRTCEEPFTVLTIDKASGQFCYDYTPSIGWRVLDPKSGKPTNERVVDLISIDSPRKDWIAFLSQFEPPGDILLKEKTEENGTVSISKLEFPRLKLSFTPKNVNGVRRLSCDQFEDYYLAEKFDVGFLNGLKGVFQLEDKSGKLRQMIIPAKGLKTPVSKSSENNTSEFGMMDLYNEGDSKSKMPSPTPHLNVPFESVSSAESLSLEHKTLLVSDSKPYYVYYGSTTQPLFKPESSSAALYLSLLMRGTQDYTRANQYLKMSEHMERDGVAEWTFIEELVLKRSRLYEPSLAAYDLHLASRMENHLKKHTKKSFDTDHKRKEFIEKTHKEFKEFTGTQYLYYQSTSSDLKEDVTAIPADLRLTSKQEMEFIQYQQPMGKQDIRKAFYPLRPPNFSSSNQSWSAWLQTTPIKDVTDPKGNYSSQTDIVRLSPDNSSSFEYTAALFFDLYNRACSPDPEVRKILKMDLFFLSRNDKTEPEQLRFLLGTLVFVSDHFKDFKPIILSENKLEVPSFHSSKVNPLAVEREKHFEAILKACADIQGPLSMGGDQNPEIDFPDIPAVYQVKKVATMPKINEIPISLKNQLTAIKADENIPLKSLFEQYFAPIPSQPPKETPFALEGIKTKSPLAQKLVHQLREGHKINKMDNVKQFKMINDSKIKNLQADLTKDLESNEKKLKDLNLEINKLANKLPASDENLRNLTETKRAGKQVKQLSLEEPLLSCYMTQDTRQLLVWNPHLTEQNVLELFKKISELLIVGRHLKLVEESLKLNERIIQASSPEERDTILDQLSKLMSAETSYDIETHPEYLVYEYATGMMLRKDQVQILDWIFNSLENTSLEHLLFQFQAGGGKTKILMPIIAFKLAQNGAFPILINYTSLYEIGKRDLDQSLSAAFKQRVELMEIEIGTDLSEVRLWSILDSLKNYHQDKKCLTVKSESIFSLIITRKRAFESGDGDMLNAVNGILDFLKKSGVALIDEAHLTLESLQETNQATGKSDSLPPNQQQLLINLTSKLAGIGKDVILVDTKSGLIPIHEKVRLLQNQQAMLTDDDIHLVRQALITDILKNPPFSTIQDSHLFRNSPPDLKQNIQGEFLNFLQDPEASYPPTLQNLHNSPSQTDRDIASSIVLVKKYLYQLMPHTLRLVQGISYGDSIHPGDYTCAPRHDKKPVSSKFQDVMVTAVLTIQNTFQTGLNQPGMKRMMEILLDEHIRQKELLESSAQLTSAQALFNEWWGTEAPQLESINLNREEDLKLCLQKIGRNTAVIEAFLKHVALPQIQIYKEKLAATPPDLLEVFGKTLAFTATPGTLELYPHQLQKKDAAKLDLSFEASVLEVLSRPENSSISIVEFKTLESLFEEIYAHDPQSFKKVSSLIDSGGIFRNSPNQDVVKAFLKFAESKGLKRDGTIFKEDQKGQGLEGNLNLLQKDKDKFSSQALAGSDLPKALKEIGKNFNELMLLTLFGLEDTTGADYKQPDKGMALLSVGEAQTKTKTIQAAMRMRRLLLGKEGQTIKWIITKELADQIPKAKLDKMTVQDLFVWMIENESQVMEKAIVMRAYQGIKHLIQKIAWNDILSKPKELQLDAYKHYRNGLVDHLESDPYLTYGKISAGKTEDVLKKYALECYKSLGFTDDNLARLKGEDLTAYKLLLNQTTTLIQTISTGQADLAGEMFQHQEVRQEQRQEQKQEVEQQAVSYLEKMQTKTEGDYTQQNIWETKFLTDSFLKDKKHSYRLLKDKLGMDFIPNDIYVSENFFEVIQPMASTNYSESVLTAPTKKEEAQVGPTVLRPVKYMLVIKETGPKKETIYKYVPCSLKGAEHFINQLDGKVWGSKKAYNPYTQSMTDINAMVPMNRSGIKKQAVLMDLKGEVVKNGNDMLGLNTEELKALKQSPDFKKRTVLLAFLNGRIQNLTLLEQITSSWSQEKFDNVWKKILEMKIGERPPDHNMMHELKRLRKWESAPFRRVLATQKTEAQAPKRHAFSVHKVGSKQPLKTNQAMKSAQTKTSWLSKFWGK